MVVVVAVVLSVAELEVSLFLVVVVASVHKNYFCVVMKKVQNSMGTKTGHLLTYFNGNY